jgi:hypothetical protein
VGDDSPNQIRDGETRVSYDRDRVMHSASTGGAGTKYFRCAVLALKGRGVRQEYLCFSVCCETDGMAEESLLQGSVELRQK